MMGSFSAPRAPQLLVLLRNPLCPLQYGGTRNYGKLQAKNQQKTWEVLPQGFRDSLHLFGQALSWDLLDLDLGPNGKYCHI